MRIAQTATWLAVGRSIKATSSLILPIILVRTLTQSDFGLYKQISLAAGLLVPFLPLGLDRGVTYFVPRKESNPAQEISTSLFGVLLPCVLAVLLGLLFPGTFGRLFGSAGIRILVAAVTATAMATIVLEIVTRGLIAVGDSRAAALLPAAIGVPSTLVLVAIAITVPTLDALATTIVITSGASILVGVVILIRKGHLRLLFDLQVLMKQLRYGGMLAIVAIVQIWANRIDRFLVSSGLTPAMFAIYAVGKTQIPFLGIIPGALGSATAPRYSRLDSESRHPEMAVLWRASAEALLPLYILVIGFLATTAVWTIPIAFTSDYADAVPVFQIFAFTFLFEALVGIDAILRALAALRFMLATVVISLPVRVGLGLAALNMGSLALLAATQLAVNAVLLVIRLVYIRRRLNVRWSLLLPHHGLVLPVVSALIGAGVTMLIGRGFGENRVAALAAACAVWGVLGAVVIWRQGLWRTLRTRERKREDALRTVDVDPSSTPD